MRWLGAVAGVGLLLLSGCGLFDETASLDTSIDPAEPLDVVVQVGDYFCCNIDDFLFGPWLVVYADGSFYRERQIGVADGVAELETVTGQLDDAGFESITEAADALPDSRSVGPDQQATDGVPLMLFAGDATWTLHTLDDPYWAFIREVEEVLDGYENRAWTPTAWIEHARGDDTCVVSAVQIQPDSAGAPIYPHVVDEYPLGPIGCGPSYATDGS